jgi:predicted RNA-binding protein YlxR (DUF448 family)
MTDADLIEADAGPRSSDRQRQCALTRTVRPVDDLIRFVAGPQGLVPDLKRKLPGRGVWVSGQRHHVADAAKRGVFARALKASVNVPADLPDLVERLLVRAALDALAIAHKAGEVAAGYARVEKSIGKERLAGLIHATDAGADGTRKLDAALARCTAIDDQKVTIIRGFTSAELDLALGRSNVVHAALLAGRASTTFLARWRDLARFRMSEDDGDRWGESAGSPAAAT